MSNPAENPQNLQNKPAKNVDMKKLYIFTTATVVIISLIAYIILLNSSRPIIAKNSDSASNAVNAQTVATTIEDENFTQDIKIEKLQQNLNNLELRIDRISLNKELPRLVLSFFELRTLIDMNMDYEVKLQEFVTLAAKDANLNQKAQQLSTILRKRNYKTGDIEPSFGRSIDKLVALKAQEDESKNRITTFFSKLITVRRIDGKIVDKGDDIDRRILLIEKFLQQKSYALALNEVEKFDDKYQKELKNFTIMLQNQVELDEVSKDIFSYLKTIVNNV